MQKIILLLFLFSAGLAYSQDSSNTQACNYKTGEFYVINGTDTCYIRRTENRQYEKCNSSDTEYQLIVVWLKKNKYILRDIHYNPSTNPRVMRKDVVMTIMETGENYHIVHVKINGAKNRLMTVYCL